ncbi:hypothetical protein Tco_0913658 [Tanacetum coccineum]
MSLKLIKLLTAYSLLVASKVIEDVQREQGCRIVGVESAVTALIERIAELERDNRKLRGTASVKGQRVDRLQRDNKKGLRWRNGNGNRGNGENGNRRNGGNRNGGNKGNGNGENGNGNGGNINRGRNKNGNHGINYEGFMPMARECTFQDFLKCMTHNLRNDSVLTWWNSHKRTIGVYVAHAMKWDGLIKLMTEGYAARSAENKRRMESNPRDNHGQQPPFKRQNVSGQNVARAYMAGNNERRGYVGPHPLCNKYRYHHVGPCTVKCNNLWETGTYKKRLSKVEKPESWEQSWSRLRIRWVSMIATTRAYEIDEGGS